LFDWFSSQYKEEMMSKLERQHVQSIIGHFETLPDPRHSKNQRHLLIDVVVISVCAVIAGAEGPTAIERWAKAKGGWLKELLELPNGIPSHDTVRRVLQALNPEAFQKCFEEWISSCLLGKDGQKSSSKSSKRHIAIDGKSLRRSHDRKSELGPLHLVSAWASDEGISLGQIATEEKSNEITAIPALLNRIDVKDTIVTIDAMGCQRNIAKQIIQAKADYILAVKDNQPKLFEAIRSHFESETEDDDQLDGSVRRCETHEKGHGRIEHRFYYLAKIPKDNPVLTKWPGAKAIGMAIRVCEQDGKTTEDTRYYIVSKYFSAQQFAAAVRGHWSIENTLHWQLDVNFREDENRTRNRQLTSNLAWLRRFAIGLLKQHPSKDSIKGKAQTAGWDNQFLMEVLTGKGS
jgi:predicted transposase YbfD/YdcC